MHNDKAKILNRLCYTELVYERINKRLHCQRSKDEIEKLIFKVINETQEQFFERKGKNIYITNYELNNFTEEQLSRLVFIYYDGQGDTSCLLWKDFIKISEECGSAQQVFTDRRDTYREVSL